MKTKMALYFNLLVKVGQYMQSAKLRDFYQIESKFKVKKVYGTNINMCFTVRKYHSHRINSNSSADYNSYTIPLFLS